MIVSVQNPFAADVLTTFDFEQQLVYFTRKDGGPEPSWGGACKYYLKEGRWVDMIKEYQSRGITLVDPDLQMDEGL